MRALSLFTGYGGIDLALKDYITQTLAYVEIEEYAQKIIAYRMADGSLQRAPIFADVKNVRGELGICDIIFGGFPCQDISVAGTGKGLEGERSGLFYEIVRLTKEIRPSFVFLENVPAIRTRGLEQVIKVFTEIGYDCRWTCLSARSVGAPHKRERWFLLAHSSGKRLERHRGSVGNKKEIAKPCKSLEVRIDTNSNGSELWKEQIKVKELNRASKPDAAMETGETPNNNSQPESLRQSIKWYKDTKHLWTMESDDWDYNASFFLRVCNGDTFRMDRIKACGNGVVPLQAKTAFEKLIGINNES
ncbi:DNA (cytosine-5-)-methyltransferase [Candidatus Dependentiae bacterium]|nr:MAG: DNA (cytosine-5-)-methyltransferase [Candidatus Dependentiae bacterium]